jgi:hypothetical protein
MSSLNHIPPTIKTGDEPMIFDNETLNFKLLDFWRWSVSDILSNATRGRLAEFIIATATNIDINQVRDEWGPYDLLTPDGIKLEIKSAAFLQSWQQSIFSTISFSTKLARQWDYLTNKRADIPQRHADVYVFCLLNHEDKATVNPLNLNHWDFYVLATHELNNYTRSQHSITLKSLQKLTSAIKYIEIDETVKLKNKLNVRLINE